MEKTKLPLSELKAMIKLAIKRELDYCNSEDTPTVCQMISTPEGREKIEALILEYVGNAGQSISQAIVSIENENNPKTSMVQ